MSWGGGENRKWTGTVSAIGGKLSELAPLGLTTDSPGSVVLVNGQISINHWTASNYGGADIDLEIAADTPDTQLKVVLFPADQPELRFETTIDASQLIRETIREPIDGGNELTISRAPGDWLPVVFKKDHLVFSPGEPFEIGIQANRINLAERSAVCRLKLFAADQKKTIPKWMDSISVALDENGSAKLQWTDIPTPDEEGVYDLQIELDPIWYQASFRHDATIRRSVQFVVLDQQARSSVSSSVKEAPWRLLSTLNPTELTSSGPRDPLKDPLNFSQFSNQLSKLAGPAAQPSSDPLGNDLRRTVQLDSTSSPMMELLPGGWQAMPIQVGRVGQPHLMEIEYLADQPTAFGLSVIQPDVGGQIPLYGFDSGVAVPNSIVKIDQQTDGQFVHRHKIVFWPTAKHPYLLIANRHQRHSAIIGDIRIFNGPQRLPVPNSVDANSLNSNSIDSSASDFTAMRKSMAFYESPLFAENFGAQKKIDPAVGQPLDDWQTFYEGADRLIQYLKSNSYQGAFITVASDGSAIYPSEILGASPRHDSGTFFSNGQDPLRKDVLEMLFRMFQREGLTLVPALAMSAPLPDVEIARHASVTGSDALALVNYDQTHAALTVGGDLPVYNPLNLQVQKTVVEVASELSNRYRDFESFGGLAIVCRPDTCTLLPGRQWGYDSATTRRFLQLQSDLNQVPDDRAQTLQLLLTTYQSQWVQWRAEQMSQWYRRMFKAVESARPGSRLYIAPVDLYRNEEASAALGPALHTTANFQDQMLQMGFEIDSFSSTPGMELLKPHRVAPNEPLSSQRVDHNVDNSRQADEFFIAAESLGDLFTHRVSWAHFAQFQEQSPFDQQASPIMRLQQLTPSAQWNRERFLNSLRIHDARILVDGGWTLSMNQDDELAELMATYRQIPDLPFQDVPLPPQLSRYAGSSLPVVVRQLNPTPQSQSPQSQSPQSSAFFYAVNASPWPVTITLNLQSGTPASFLDCRTQRPFATNERDQITFVMPPLSLLAGKSSQAALLSSYQFSLPTEAADPLRKHLYSLQTKLVTSTSAAPIAGLENSDFEVLGQPSLSGWDFGQQATSKIRLESQQTYQGRGSLSMNNDSQRPVWIRSNVIQPPTTGRLSLSVWLRTDNPAQQPPLRLSVEGKTGETNYYRFGSVGSLSPSPSTNQLSSQWQRFAVHFDDLPIDRLANLRIGLDLMGAGNVQIDHVEILDRWFDENDAKAITQRLASCGPLLSNPATVESCRQLLDDYWLRFLDEYSDNGPSVTSLPNASPAEAPLSTTSDNQKAVEDPRTKPKFRRFRKIGASRKQSLR